MIFKHRNFTHFEKNNVVISISKILITMNTFYKVCSRCKVNKPSTEYYLYQDVKLGLRGRKPSSWCKECCKLVANARHKGIVMKVTKVPNIMTKAMARLSGNIHSACYIKYNRGKDCHNEMTIAHLRELYSKQNGKCFYKDVTMKLENNLKKDPLLISVDRIDSTKGYMEGNVVLCCLGMNWLKNIHDEQITMNCLKTFYEGAKSIGKISTA